MDSSILLWTVDATRGSVNFGRLIPFAGNTYELVFIGVDVEEVYTAYVMDESGLKCLAKSEHNAAEYTIAFNSADLRDEFERNMHEVQTFHVIVRDSKRVVAEGDLSVQWQSLWEDTTTGEVFTMRGPKGEPGAPGRKGDPGNRGSSAYDIALMNGFDGSEEDWLKTLKGVPGSLVRVQKIDENGEETGKWHNVFVKPDQNGRLRIVIGKTEYEPNASEDVYVSTMADMSISGIKEFLQSPIVPVITDPSGEVNVADDSGKAVNTKWIRAWWTKIWEGILATTQKFSAECTFIKGIVGDLKGNVKGDVVGDLEGTADKAIADKNGNKIHETYLPLAGGTISGTIVKSGSARSLSRDTDNSATQIVGGTDDKSAYLNLYGSNYQTGSNKGSFTLAASNGTDIVRFVGKPDGTLTWGGNDVVLSRSSSTWRIVDLGGGFVMMWAHIVGNGTYTLPLPMADASYTVFSAIDKINGGYNERHNITRTTTSFKVDSGDGVNGYIIIGKKA